MIATWFDSAQLGFAPAWEWSEGDKRRHPEVPERATLLRDAAVEAGWPVKRPEPVPRKVLARAASEWVLTLLDAARSWDATEYPSVFPIDRRGADPTDPAHLGAFTLDTGTPVGPTTRDAVWASAGSAWSAARAVKAGAAAAYALCRPPGHHAARDWFGGYCYVNNAVVAARTLGGRVGVLDVDLHHGNGTQALLWRSPTLFVDLHGDPLYPYTGRPDEQGAGAGRGRTVNLPLPHGTDGSRYLGVLEDRVAPLVDDLDALVLSLGFDTFVDDPIGAFALRTPDYAELGRWVAARRLPLVIVQEGGYDLASLGANATAFLQAVREHHRPR